VLSLSASYRRMKRLILLGLLWWEIGLSLYAQTGEVGIPYLRYFEGKGNTSEIIQDRRGIIYTADKEGIVEFDGKHWRPVKDIGLQTICLTQDKKGRIFVGGTGIFGMLVPDTMGQVRYRPLDKLVSKEERQFQNIWSVQAIEDGVFFQSDFQLFRYKTADNTIRSWQAPKGGSFFLTYEVHERLYVHVKGIGLHVFQGDSLALVNKGWRMASEDIMAVLPFGTNQLMVATRSKGLMLYDGQDFYPFVSPANEYLIKNELYKAVQYSEDTYAFGTQSGGLVLMHRSGTIRQIINLAEPFLKKVNCMTVDRQGGIWIANEKGIIRIESPLYLTIHSTDRLRTKLPSTGIEGAPGSVIVWGGKTFVATNQGLFVSLSDDPLYASEKRFINIAPNAENFQRLVRMGAKLIVSSDKAVYEVVNNSLVRLYVGTVNDISPSRTNPNRLMVCTDAGMMTLDYNGGGWQAFPFLPELVEPAHQVMEDQDGTIWVLCSQRGIYAFRPTQAQEGKSKHYQSVFYHPKNGLPYVSEKNKLFSIKGKTYVYVFPNGISSFNAKSNTFERDSTFGSLFSNGTHSVLTVTTDTKGSIWFAVRDLDEQKEIKIYQVQELNGRYVPKKLNFRRFLDFEPNNLFVQTNGILWVSGSPGVLRLNLNEQKVNTTFQTVIRRFRFYTKKTSDDDAIRFYGTFWDKEGNIQPSQLAENIKQYPFIRSNRIRFEWTATSYNDDPDDSRIEYQYYLEGQVEGVDSTLWSKWTKENFADYTNLNAYGFPKTYILHVRARDANGVISPETTYAFIIEPPFYQNIWAFIFYGISGLVLIFLGNQAYTARLRDQKRKLELKVQEATFEIMTKKDELEVINSQLSLRTRELEESQLRLSQQNDRLNEQNHLLSTQKEEISRQKDQLDQSYHTIQDQLNTIVTQQDQLVQSQKMAALGEITPIVAHEINTPLGAIKGGLQVISSAITPLLHDIPRLINRLDADLQAQFWQFLESVQQPSAPVSTKEERSLIRKMESLLEENGIADPDEMATSLIRIGCYGDITPHLPFLQQVATDEEIKQEVIQIGMLWKQVHTMTAAADKAQQKIKALQFYVGNASAAAERKAEPVSVQETIDAVLTLYDFYISQGTEVSKQMDASLTVWAYPQELIQVWTNLIMSAVYAMNKKGSLSITAVREEAFAVISFADTAPEPIDAEHVFDAGTNSRQTQPPISLAICKLRAEEYGGAITVRSEEGINRVELRLPLVGA